MDMARLNFSHGTGRERDAAAEAVRRSSAEKGRRVGILADLAGPKIRLGEIERRQATLQAGTPFTLRTDGRSRPGDASGAQVSYRALGGDVRPGDRILLADGAAELLVTAAGGDVATEVVRGGVVRSRAGVAVPAARLSTPALTAKDRADIPR